MATQQDIWEQEHKDKAIFRGIHSRKSSEPLPDFVDFLRGEGVKEGAQILDIGCGNGRNSFYLAKQGFSVIGVDFSSRAIKQAQLYAQGKKLPVQFDVVDLADDLPFADGRFHAVIDCNTTICMPSPGRGKAIGEAYRVLQQGGYYLFYGPAYSEFAKEHSGPEEHSAVFPKSGKFEKQYTEDELLRVYRKHGFEYVRTTHITGKDTIEGDLVEFLLIVAIFKKP